LFDKSNDKLICWGKVLAEDKTAPVITAAPSGAKFLCTEVTAVLNNPKTVGTYAAGNGKVGDASATDNCGGKCACEQPTIINGRLKFSDRVVYYNCPQGTQWEQNLKQLRSSVLGRLPTVLETLLRLYRRLISIAQM